MTQLNYFSGAATLSGSGTWSIISQNQTSANRILLGTAYGQLYNTTNFVDITKTPISGWYFPMYPWDQQMSISEIFYYNNKYYANGYNQSGQNVFWESTDASTWSSSSMTFNAFGPSSYYTFDKTGYLINGQNFLTINSNGGREYSYSTDGINFNTANFPSTYHHNSIDRMYFATYGNGLYFVSPQTGVAYYYSTDMVNWTTGLLPINGVYTYLGDAYPYHPSFANGYFFLAYQNSNKLFYSSDLVNWNETTVSAIPNYVGIQQVIYFNGKYIIRGAGSTYYYSTDLVNWTTSSIPVTYSGPYVVSGNKIVAFDSSMDFNNAQSAIAYSSDGETWTTTSFSLDYGYDYFFMYGGGIIPDYISCIASVPIL